MRGAVRREGGVLAAAGINPGCNRNRLDDCRTAGQDILDMYCNEYMYLAGIKFVKQVGGWWLVVGDWGR